MDIPHCLIASTSTTQSGTATGRGGGEKGRSLRRIVPFEPTAGIQEEASSSADFIPLARPTGKVKQGIESMNFVAQVEDHLRDLASSAGSRGSSHGASVRDASESAILRLRSLQTSYVAAVRAAAAGPGRRHPDTSHFRSRDVLRPFLLAAGDPSASSDALAASLGG
ncbi:hypothetical protein THAOC_26337, partial [Thalassiosira oceanica]